MIFHIELEYKDKMLSFPIMAEFNRKGWEFFDTDKTLSIGSVSRKKVVYRNKMFLAIQDYFQCLFKFNIVVKMESIRDRSILLKKLDDKNLSDDDWFYAIMSKRVENKENISFPPWKFPEWDNDEKCGCSSTPANMYKILKNFLNSPEIKEKIKKIDTYSNFGL